MMVGRLLSFREGLSRLSLNIHANLIKGTPSIANLLQEVAGLIRIFRDNGS